jgi:LytR cell envelope-related transcriptional attenuator
VTPPSSTATRSASPGNNPTATSSKPKSSKPKSSKPKSSKPKSTAKPTTAVPSGVGIVIANNTSQAGLADTARSRFKGKGWKVTDLTNFRGGVLSTCVYYSSTDPAYKRAAELLRTEFPGHQTDQAAVLPAALVADRRHRHP